MTPLLYDSSKFSKLWDLLWVGLAAKYHARNYFGITAMDKITEIIEMCSQRGSNRDIGIWFVL